MPGQGAAPVGFTPFSPVPSRAQNIQSGVVIAVSRILTAAEFLALNVTPVVVVADIPGKLILPLFWFMDKDTTVVGTTAAIDLRWTGTANVAVTAMSVGCNSLGRLTSQARGADTTQSAGAVNPTGKGLSVKAAGALTGTTAIVVGVAFYVVNAIADHA